jgi:hypothetical protein
MENTRDEGIDRLLERVRPRWDRERHERVFATIVERIRRDEGRDEKPANPRGGLRLSHAAR